MSPGQFSVDISTGPLYIGGGTIGLSTATSNPVALGDPIAPRFITATTVSRISTGPGVLWAISAYTTSTGTANTALPGLVRLYNAATSGVTAGSSVVWSFPIAVFATATAGSLAHQAPGDHHQDFSPRGMAFSVGCSVDVGTLSTGVVTLANAKISALYST